MRLAGWICYGTDEDEELLRSMGVQLGEDVGGGARACELGEEELAWLDGQWGRFFWELKPAPPKIRYGLKWMDGPFGRAYQLIVHDAERDWRGSINFAVHPAFGEESALGLRAELEKEHDRAETKLWLGVKQRSPGTYLDARIDGLVPASVTKRDRRVAKLSVEFLRRG